MQQFNVLQHPLRVWYDARRVERPHRQMETVGDGGHGRHDEYRTF
ncbi:hypothetical protein ILFOPFJJ_01081 [Ensifer psoraleae]|nr:hypothetical protein [Sinorhizobium psoraleae]